jgi:hypothetical protein
MTGHPFVILTATVMSGPGAMTFDSVPVHERKLVVDVDEGEVWLAINGPLVFDALREGRVKPLAALVDPERLEDCCAMAPVSWLETVFPDERAELHLIRDTALATAREALGVRLQ